MSQHLDRQDRTPGDRPGVFRVLSRSLRFTCSHLWRLFMASLMACLFSVGMWSGLIIPAHAASLAHQGSSQHQSTLALNVPQSPHLPGFKQAQASTSIAASLSNHEQSVGDQPYYTYIMRSTC